MDEQQYNSVEPVPNPHLVDIYLHSENKDSFPRIITDLVGGIPVPMSE